MADCKNDCRPPLRFPKKIDNRPKLPRIDYRIGEYADFREAMLRKLDTDPVLAGWTYRAPDDPGIALIESAAIVGDILTLYQDTYANELYLETATLRESIASLVRLTGYRLSPGVGGRATFAFQVKGEKPVMIPAKFPVTADVDGLDEPAAFETSAALNAIPALSKFALYRAFDVPPVRHGSRTFAVETASLNIELAKGDRLMLIDPAGGNNPYHQVAVIEKVEARFEQTEITMRGAWLGTDVPALTVYKLGRDFRHFGHNAPPERVVIASGIAKTEPVGFERFNILSIVGPFAAFTGFDPLAVGNLPLDKAVEDISAGSGFLIETETTEAFLFAAPRKFATFGAYSVRGVRQASLTWGSMTGSATVLLLDSFINLGTKVDIRTVQAYETKSGPFTCTAPRVPNGADARTLYFLGNGVDYEALDGRVLHFHRRKPLPGQPEADEQIPVAIASSEIGTRSRVTLRKLTLQAQPSQFAVNEFPLVFPKDQPPVWVYGNLASATQGKTEKPVVLGNGDARAEFLTLAIPKAPLTYLLSKSATPPEVGQLIVTVNGIEWTQVPSLLACGPKDLVYIVREDRNGQSYVQFGDGETGARVPSGEGNIECTYRTGNGAHGPMKPGAEPGAGARLPLLDGIAMAGESSGGAEPEEGENARHAAPGKVQSLGRIVSVRDYETEALSIPGVSAASAAWSLVDSIPLVSLTVLLETGRASEFAAITDILHSYNVCRGPQRHALLVMPGTRSYIFCDISIALAPGHLEENVFPQVRAALDALFGANRGFGAREYRSRIEGIVQNVEGVQRNDVTSLGSLGPSDDPAKLHVPAPPRPLQETLPCGGHQMLALHSAHLTLAAVAAPVKVC